MTITWAATYKERARHAHGAPLMRVAIDARELTGLATGGDAC